MADIFAIVTTPETQDDDIIASWKFAEKSDTGMIHSTDGSTLLFNAIQYGREQERKRLSEKFTEGGGSGGAGPEVVTNVGPSTFGGKGGAGGYGAPVGAVHFDPKGSTGGVGQVQPLKCEHEWSYTYMGASCKKCGTIVID